MPQADLPVAKMLSSISIGTGQAVGKTRQCQINNHAVLSNRDYTSYYGKGMCSRRSQERLSTRFYRNELR